MHKKKIYGLAWLSINQLRGAAVTKKMYKQNSISKTHEVIPLLCTSLVRLPSEYFVQFCFIFSKTGGGLADMHIEERSNSDFNSGNHDL